MQNNPFPTYEQLEEFIDKAVQKSFHRYVPVYKSLWAEPPTQSDVLNVKQTSEFLNLAISTIYGLVHKKELPHFKKGHKLRFKRSELLEWIESGQKKTTQQAQSSIGIFTRKPSKANS